MMPGHLFVSSRYPTTYGLGGPIFVRPNVSLFFALDVSGSMDTNGRLTMAKNALHEAVDLVEVSIPLFPSGRFDVGMGSWSTGGANNTVIHRLNATLSDMAALRSWIDGRTTGGGTDFRIGAQQGVDWFDLTPAVTQLERRGYIFMTDGEPNATGLTATEVSDAAAAIIADLLDRDSGVFKTVDGTDVDCYGINIDLTNTAHTVKMDNTPEDGVPVIDSGNPELLGDLIRALMRK